MELLIDWVKLNNSDILNEWDYEKNKEIDITKMAAHSSKSVFWICKNSHSYQAKIAKRTIGQGCPYCAGKKVLCGYNDIKSQYKDIADEWDYQLNAPLKPSDITKGYGKKVYWICCQCNNSYPATVSNRIRGCGCPYCSGRKVKAGTNDLLSQKVEISTEWDYEKNQVDPSEILSTSTTSYWWKCSLCGEEFKAEPLYRTSIGCPSCHRKEVVERRIKKKIDQGKGLNQTKYQHLVKEWDYEKNEKMGINLDCITCNSNRKVWWKCGICGYEWPVSPAHRVSQGTGCPCCAGKVIVSGKNDLETLGKDLLSEWDYTRNDKLPSNVFAHSGTNYYWICQKCGHLWKTSPNNRMKGGMCTRCRGISTSFPEQAIFYYFNKFFETFNRYKNDKVNKEIDIYIPSLKMGIEYDGYRYHINKKEDDEKKTIDFMKLNIQVYHVREKKYSGEALPILGLDSKYLVEYDVRKRYTDLDTVICYLLSCAGVKENECKNVNTYDERFNIYHQMYQMRIENSFATSGNISVNLWDDDANYPLKPNEVSLTSKIEVNWRCKKCGIKWSRSVLSQAKSKGCPNCNCQVVTDKYNFASLYPDILRDWDYERNVVDPYSLKPFSHDIFNWVCHKCGHEWSQKLSARTTGAGCSKCGQKKATEARQKKVLQIDKLSEQIIEEFPSARMAEKITGISYKGISACCTGNKKSYGGFKWRFKDIDE